MSDAAFAFFAAFLRDLCDEAVDRKAAQRTAAKKAKKPNLQTSAHPRRLRLADLANPPYSEDSLLSAKKRKEPAP
jgi:hypothetical protein